MSIIIVTVNGHMYTVLNTVSIKVIKRGNFKFECLSHILTVLDMYN